MSGVGVGWPLVVALTALLALGAGVAWRGQLRIEREIVVAALRAVLQLAAVGVILHTVLTHRWASVLFAIGMFAVAVWTAGGRDEARRDWPWIAVALGVAVAPVLAIVFGSGVAPLTGPAIIPIAGIITGGAMTAHTLATRRAFATLREDKGLVEAGLALGFQRSTAIRLAIDPHAAEALLPAIDQTRTVGLVTLPGAFVGVLLGGGSAADAAAAQLLVLIGHLAAETITVVTSRRLIAAGRLLAPDLRRSLPRS